MASLQTLAESTRTREEVYGRPRTLVIANERSLGVLTIRHEDAKQLMRDGLIAECPMHDLHLVEYREWDLDDVERLLIAIARFDKKKHDGSLPTLGVMPITIEELKRRTQPVYDPDPLSVGEELVVVEVAPLWYFAGYAVLAALFVIAVGAYIGFSV